MNTTHTIVGLGLTMAAAVTATVAPALADTATPEPISAVITKVASTSRQTPSEVTVEVTWATPHLTPGSTLTVGSFNWLEGFPFTLDDGTRIGECAADQTTITCTVTDVPEAWAAKENVAGTFHARAQLTPTPHAPTPAPRVTTSPVPVPTHTTPTPQASTQHANAPAQRLDHTGGILNGIKAALAALAMGIFLTTCVYVSNRRGMGGNGR